MSDKQLISKVRNFAIKNSESNDIHGFPHVERVLKNCIKLGEKIEVNLKVLKIAALLHDTGRIKELTDPEHRNHAEISAELANDFLKSLNGQITEGEITRIMHAIQAHSFSNKVKPETIEAKILSDVDKLDGMGAIGIYRTIGFTIQKQGGLKEVIYHLENKILKLKDLLYLEESKKLAKERHEIVLDFYNTLMKEN